MRDRDWGRTARTALGVAAVWGALSTLWAVHVLEFAQGTVASAAMSGAVSMGIATLLSLGVWALSANRAWASRLASDGSAQAKRRFLYKSSGDCG